MPAITKSNLYADLQLTDSQNFFTPRDVRMQFLRGTFNVYLLIFVPTLIALLVLWNSESYKDFTEENVWLFVACAVISLLSSLLLALSKIAARKKGLAYILYVVFILTFAHVVAYLITTQFYQTWVILILMLISNAIALRVYLFIVTKRFRLKEAIFIVVGFLLVPLIAFRFIYKAHLVTDVLSFFITLLISLIIMCASEFMCENKNFDMLPDDYVMGAMKIMTIAPLIAEFMNYEPMNDSELK